MPTILLLALTVAEVVGKVASKTCSNIIAAKSSRIKYFIYLIIVGIIACGVLFTLNGFKVSCNPRTLLYALVYSVICSVIAVCGLEIMKYANISGVLVLSSLGSLISSALVGAFIFGEDIAPKTLVKMGIMFIPAVLTFIEAKQSQKESAKKRGKSAIIKLAVILLILITVRCGNNVLIKLYRMDSGVTDISSMFIFTNLFQSLTSLVPLIVYVIRKHSTPELRAEIADAKSILRLLPIIAIIANTTTSNVVSLISAELIGLMDISLYTPTVSALGMISGVIASFIYRERHGVFFYISAALAVIAVII